MQRYRASEDRLRNEKKSSGVQDIPPPPILVHRGSSVMIFKPSPFFEPKSGETVHSYSLFLRNAAGNNVKVRLVDRSFKGTGEQVWRNYCKLFDKITINIFNFVVALNNFNV